MRLKEFEIKNFKGIETLKITWEDLIVLIGENNCGKSSVLSAIALFLSGSAIKDPLLFRKHQTDANNAIEFTGHFDQLTQVEKQQIAVRGKMHNDQWILKKRYWLQPADDEDAGGWKEQLFTYSSESVYSGWPEQSNSWASFSEDYQGLIAQIPDRPARPNAALKETLKSLVRAARPDLITQSEPSWIVNPGGGGNWKSNANSVLPRVIFVRAVHEASDETNAKDASTYGKLINLVVERQLATKPEMIALRSALENVLKLFTQDDDNPNQQAQEIRDIQDRINEGLSEVIGGTALIRTEPPELRSVVMPSTSLVIKDPLAGIETQIGHQGHGLQRTLIITLLQILSNLQDQSLQAELNDIDQPAVIPEADIAATGLVRQTILLIEEPELYLHPQMERLMRDLIYKLASQVNIQVACCTHSPIFLDIANRYQSIVRLSKRPSGDITGNQVVQDLFPGQNLATEKAKLQTVARFHPTVNELFFAKHVVLFEEFSAIAAIQTGAEITGIFDRKPRIKHEVAFVDCDGKNNITAFQRILNAFSIPYRVIHDLDHGNPAAFAENARISALLPNTPQYLIHAVDNDLESLLGYAATKGSSKPFTAVTKVLELEALGNIPPLFITVLNMAYFGQANEP